MNDLFEDQKKMKKVPFSDEMFSSRSCRLERYFPESNKTSQERSNAKFG